MAGLSSFLIDVPQVDIPGIPSLMLLSVYVDLEADAEVTFRITSPNPGGKDPLSPLTISPYGPSSNPTGPPSNDFWFHSTTQPPAYLVSVVRAPNNGASDPLSRRYQFFISLFSDYNISTGANTNLPGVTTEQWKFEIVDNADLSPKTTMAGAGVVSFTMPNNQPPFKIVRGGGNAATIGITLDCTLNGTPLVTIPLPGTAANLLDDMRVSGNGITPGTTILSINTAVSPNQFTLSAPATTSGAQTLEFTRVSDSNISIAGSDPRLGVDAVLVLDRSGSMASAAIDGQATPTRIQELQQSLQQFSTVWKNLRTSEAADGQAPSDDHIGVTIFDDVAEWWSSLPSTGLNLFTDGLDTTIQTPAIIGTITARNTTSIGGGLEKALAPGTFDFAASRRRVVLLMTDGLQNANPMVSVVDNKVVTTNGPLANQDNYQIYTVTVGPSNLVNAQINQQIAQASNGFYTNSENDATLLNPFFLELLQNFVHFTSWETFRLVRAQLTTAAPSYLTTVPVSTTTVNVSVALRAPQPRAVLRLSVTPPGEATATQAVTHNGSVVLNFSLPTSAAYDPMGQWNIVVDVPPSLVEESRVAAAGAIFDLVVLGDDLGLHGELGIVPGDYVPGQPIQLEARLREFGKPVTGLGSQPGDRLLVEVVKPGVGVGDLLSDSNAPSTPPFPSDPTSPAQSKLFNQIQADPASLSRISGDVVTLVDDGTGVYRGSYPVQLPGHYNFLFGIEGTAKGVHGFSRQQLKSVYVRPKPDGAATAIQTSTQVLGGGSQLTISFTPRTAFGNRLGPGWANYFWLTSPGQTPFKAVDNLDGSYTAKLLYGGLFPPPVTLNFIDGAVMIDDATPPSQLPVPLGAGTVLVPFVNTLPFPLPLPLPLLIILLLLIAFILGLVIGLLI